MKGSMLTQFRATMLEQGLGIYGIHVFHSGQDPVMHHWRSNDPVCLYSASKTFTSVGVGIAVDEGRLSLTDTVLDFFPEHKDAASDDTGTITIRDLLHMSSGKKVFYFSGDEDRMKTQDWAELFFTDPMQGKPGKQFFYANSCTYMLSRIIERVSGHTLRDYLVPRLFEPLGIFNPQWHMCPGKHTLGATALYLKTEELALLGQVFLSGGSYKDKKIISREYLASAVSDMISTSDCGYEECETRNGYGYQLWRCSHDGAYRADGLYGQFCIVFPDRDAVVTITAHEEKRPYDLIQAVYTDILPNLE
ncbi:MAG: serine hydrolase domain-containing protein [Saccharofermentanales bacterium]